MHNAGGGAFELWRLGFGALVPRGGEFWLVWGRFGPIWTELWGKHGPAPQVEGDGAKGDLGAGFDEAAIADELELHAVLEGGESGLHRCPPSGDQPVVELEPGRQFGVVLVGPRGLMPAALSRAQRPRV